MSTASFDAAIVRVAQLAVSADALYRPLDVDDPVLEALDYMVVASLGFASTRPDEAWDATEPIPTPPSVGECVDEISELIIDWPEAVCATHPDWAGFYTSLSTAREATRRAHAS